MSFEGLHLGDGASWEVCNIQLPLVMPDAARQRPFEAHGEISSQGPRSWRPGGPSFVFDLGDPDVGARPGEHQVPYEHREEVVPPFSKRHHIGALKCRG